VACRLIRPGNTNQQVTNAMMSIADTFHVHAIHGSIMHQMKRYVIDGNKRIALANPEKGPSSTTIQIEKVDPINFEVYEVYAVDITFSTGDGKSKDKGLRTTVYKRNIDKKYGLKVKASRTFFNEINMKFPTFPFSLRELSDEKNARLGIRECLQHELISAYPILSENKGDLIAHVKFTVLVLPSRTAKITGMTLTEGSFQADSDCVLTEELQAILAMDDGNNKKKKDKSKKKKGGAGAAEEEG
jgi:curved DNA binding protein